MSVKLDACIAFTRSEVEAKIQAITSPQGQTLLALQKWQRGERLDPDEVVLVAGTVLERERAQEASP